ncbi:MAG: trypsin-like serine protease [Streptosporangiales bacterium]|nr:trypsin-like serine protease [Streptosporangiales bacterium]
MALAATGALAVAGLTGAAAADSDTPAARPAGVDPGRLVSAAPAATAAAGQAPAAVAKAAVDYWTPSRMRSAIPVDGAGQAGTAAGTSDVSTKATVIYHKPHRTVGKVFFTGYEAGSWANYVCSASTVPGSKRNVVLTAGHCVHGINGTKSTWHRNWVYVPAYESGKAPYGKWAAERFWAWSRYTQRTTSQGSLDYDYAFVNVWRTTSGRGVSSYTGNNGLLWNKQTSWRTLAWGYPAQSPYTGAKPYTCSTVTKRDTTYYTGRQLVIPCKFVGGASGGPWLWRSSAGNWYAYGVNSTADRKLRTWSPFFNGYVKSLWDYANKYAPQR